MRKHHSSMDQRKSAYRYVERSLVCYKTVCGILEVVVDLCDVHVDDEKASVVSRRGYSFAQPLAGTNIFFSLLLPV